MKYIQIISVCEGKSDEIYLRRIYKHYEDIKVYNIKYDFVLLKGKTNYKQKKILSNIEKKKNKYKNINGKSYVVYFIDTDNVITNQKNIKIYQDISSFVNKNSFELVFFNKDIEDVINKNASKKDKLREAKAYFFDSSIDKRLKIKNFKTLNSSNLLLILKKLIT